MLSAIATGLKATKDTNGYLPIKILANYISEDWFCRYFYAEQGKLKLDIYFSQLRSELGFLINWDYLYVDYALFLTADLPTLKSSKGILQFNFTLGKVQNLKESCNLIIVPIAYS